MGVQDYKPMEKAPMDGTVVLVLAGSRKPRAAYWDYKAEGWKFWHAPKEDCYPAYWTDLPADPPSDFLPELKTMEDEESHSRELHHGVLMDEVMEAGKAPPESAKVKKEAKVEAVKSPFVPYKPAPPAEVAKKSEAPKKK
jgi:hypothetical protein